MKKVKEKELEELERKYSNSIAAMLFQALEIGCDDDGLLYYGEDEDDDDKIYLQLHNKYCVDPSYADTIDPENPNLIVVDPFGNSKHASFFNVLYCRSKNYGIRMWAINNESNKPDNFGNLVMTFENGVTIDSHEYYRDSLKFIDLIFRLERMDDSAFKMLKKADEETMVRR